MAKERKTATDGDPDAFVYTGSGILEVTEEEVRSALIMADLRKAMSVAPLETHVIGLYERIVGRYPPIEKASDFGGFSLGDPAGDEFVLKARKD